MSPHARRLSLSIVFFDLVNPRMARTRRHELFDIAAIALCAVLAGAKSWVEVEEWREIKLTWLLSWLPMPHGISPLGI